jgi:hypothetical protein
MNKPNELPNIYIHENITIKITEKDKSKNTKKSKLILISEKK